MGRIGKIHLANISRYVSQAEVATVAHANSEAQPPLLDLKTWRYTKSFFNSSLCDYGFNLCDSRSLKVTSKHY